MLRERIDDATDAHLGSVVLTITRDEARVWKSGLDKWSHPDKIRADDEMTQHHHVRQAQHHRGHDTDHLDRAFYEDIADAVAGASRILIVGHGKGKADQMLRLVQHLERHRPEIARRVVGAIDSNLMALTDREVLAVARTWFVQRHRPGLV